MTDDEHGSSGAEDPSTSGPEPHRGSDLGPAAGQDSFPPHPEGLDAALAEGPASAVGADVLPDDTEALPPETTVKAERSAFWKELPILLGIALVLALLIKAFLVQAFYIPSSSMENTLQVNDRVLVNKLVHNFRDIKRGEIVVFDANGSLAPDPGVRTIEEPGNPISKAFNKISTTLGFGVPPGEQDYIKRVIAVGGDRIMCCDAQDRVVVTPKGSSQGVALDEPYLFENNVEAFCEAGITSAECPPGSAGVLVPEGRIFVMGDHRGASSDSRAAYKQEFREGRTNQPDSANGTVDEDLVIGRAFVVVWPLSHLDWLSIPDLFEQQAMASTPYAVAGLCVLPLALLRRRQRRRAGP